MLQINFNAGLLWNTWRWNVLKNMSTACLVSSFYQGRSSYFRWDYIFYFIIYRYYFSFNSLSFFTPDFYHPFKEDEVEQSTVVEIMFPSEPPVRIHLQWRSFTIKRFKGPIRVVNRTPPKWKGKEKENKKGNEKSKKNNI